LNQLFTRAQLFSTSRATSAASHRRYDAAQPQVRHVVVWLVADGADDEHVGVASNALNATSAFASCEAKKRQVPASCDDAHATLAPIILAARGCGVLRIEGPAGRDKPS